MLLWPARGLGGPQRAGSEEGDRKVGKQLAEACDCPLWRPLARIARKADILHLPHMAPLSALLGAIRPLSAIGIIWRFWGLLSAIELHWA
eukprot:625777-Pyramimonas_sp.AAC.1